MGRHVKHLATSVEEGYCFVLISWQFFSFLLIQGHTSRTALLARLRSGNWTGSGEARSTGVLVSYSASWSPSLCNGCTVEDGSYRKLCCTNVLSLYPDHPTFWKANLDQMSYDLLDHLGQYPWSLWTRSSAFSVIESSIGSTLLSIVYCLAQLLVPATVSTLPLDDWKEP